MILNASEAQAYFNKIKRAEEELKRRPDDAKLLKAVGDAKKAAKKNAAAKAYEKALSKLLPFQRADFEGVFEAMDGLPVIIRLIDPPLHEFLPSFESLLEEVTELKTRIDVLGKIKGYRSKKGEKSVKQCRPSWKKRKSCSSRQRDARSQPDAGLPRHPPGHHLSGHHRDAGARHL